LIWHFVQRVFDNFETSHRIAGAFVSVASSFSKKEFDEFKSSSNTGPETGASLSLMIFMLPGHVIVYARQATASITWPERDMLAADGSFSFAIEPR
jgi:hypothetical protein